MTNFDPTYLEMYEYLNTKYNQLDKDTLTSNIPRAIYWFSAHHHTGQTSNLYAVLGNKRYRPGCRETGMDPEFHPLSHDMYMDLKKLFS